MKLLEGLLRFVGMAALFVALGFVYSRLFPQPVRPELLKPSIYSELERLNNHHTVPDYSFLRQSDFARWGIHATPPTLIEQLREQAEMQKRNAANADSP